MEETTREQLCAQLDTADASLRFLTLIVLSVCLSWSGVALQRRELYSRLSGGRGRPSDLSPLRITAGALVAAALIFFFGLALDSWEQADRQSRPAAQRDLWASLFVLAAALLRLQALLRPQDQDGQDGDLPD